MKKSLLRKLAIVLLILAFAGYFAFSTLLFPPVEGEWEGDLSNLVSDQVDFYVSKAQLNRDFAEFPDLELAQSLESSKAWRVWKDSPESADFSAKYNFTAQLDNVRKQLEQLPSLPGLELPAVFGGKDLAVAGRFAGRSLETADWVAYGRMNFWGKLGLSGLKYPGLLGLEKQGLSVAAEGDVLTLTGGQLQKPLYLTRHKDVGVVGTQKELVDGVAELAVRGGQNSFGQSARYYDNIARSRLRSKGDELEVFIKSRALMEDLLKGGRWPDPNSQDFLPALMGKLFQLASLNEVVGVMDFNDGIQLDVRGELSSETITAEQTRIYRSQGFEQPQLMNVARLARADSSMFVYGATDMQELLRQVFASLEPAVQSLIGDSLRSMGSFQDAGELITELDDIFFDRIAVITRPNDFEYNYSGAEDKQDPPHNGDPVPAVALVFWIRGEKGRERIEEYHNLVAQHQGKLGLEGHKAGSKGVFFNEIFGGHVVWEFWNKQIPGTGHISSVQAGGELYIISNSYKMVENTLRTYYFGEPDDPQLAELPQFQALVSSSLPVANAVCWINPQRLAVTRRQVSELAAESAVRSKINWEIERPKMERTVLAESYGGQAKQSLSEGDLAQLNVTVSERLTVWENNLLAEQLPVYRGRSERAILYSEACTGLLSMLSLDPRSIEFSLRAMFPLDDE